MRSARSLASAQAASTRARATVGGRVGTSRLCFAVRIERGVDASGLQQAPSPPLVEQPGPPRVGGGIDPVQRLTHQLRRPLQVARPAGGIGRPVEQLFAGEGEVVGIDVGRHRAVPRVQRPFVEALCFGQRIDGLSGCCCVEGGEERLGRPAGSAQWWSSAAAGSGPPSSGLRSMARA